MSEYSRPKNHGKLWTPQEEYILLKELSQNQNVSTIAKNHERTKSGIERRCKHIAYQMFLNNEPIEKILNITKISNDSINEFMFKKEVDSFSLEKEIEYLKELLIQKDEQITLLKELLNFYKKLNSI